MAMLVTGCWWHCWGRLLRFRSVFLRCAVAVAPALSEGQGAKGRGWCEIADVAALMWRCRSDAAKKLPSRLRYWLTGARGRCPWLLRSPKPARLPCLAFSSIISHIRAATFCLLGGDLPHSRSLRPSPAAITQRRGPGWGGGALGGAGARRAGRDNGGRCPSPA